MELTFDRWRALTNAEREATARQIARQLPSGFQFRSIETCHLGEQQNPVAVFTQGEATFALVPGGTVTLGFDAFASWEPNAEEAEDWREVAAYYRWEKTIQEYIARVVSPPRSVTLAPLLVEATSRELGWEEVNGREMEARSPGKRYADTVLVDREQTHGELDAEVRADGFRFPTTDEWEYACGGGAATLFRWGDHAPADRYPTDNKPRRPRGDPALNEANVHRQPNAFGLHIASNPYHSELVAEIGTTRGGDGGEMLCGGTPGFFLGWLTLATAYAEEVFCQHDPDEPIATGYTVGRRVLELR